MQRDPTTSETCDLAAQTCVPCRGGVPPVTGPQLERLTAQLDAAWTVVDGHHLRREYPFVDFATALAYVNRLGAIADAEGHHPDLLLAWGRVRVEIWTHKIDGLTVSDFVLAAKAERCYRDLP